MKFLLFVRFSLFAAAFYFFSHDFHISEFTFTGKRSLREQMFPLHHGNGYERYRVLDEDKGQMTFPENFKQQKHLRTTDLELVYHIDYNGVTTHPIPTPKHPRP